jgi:magnesium transporter
LPGKSMNDLPETPEQVPESEAALDPVYAVTPEFVRAVAQGLQANESALVRELITPLHAADTADLLGYLPGDLRGPLLDVIGSDLLPEVLSELDESVRDDVVELFEPHDLAAAVTELETDDAVFVIEDLDQAQQAEVLRSVPAEERAALVEGLSYDEDTAGRLMQRDLIAVPAYWTVGQTIDYLRETADLPESFHEIFVVDPAHHPIGAVYLDRVLRTKRPIKIIEIMDPDLRRVPVEMDQEQVGYLFQQYGLLSAPAVDAEGRLVGVIMVDDVVEVIHEEVEEDTLRLAGVQEDDLNDSVTETARTRFSWLLVNLGTAALASLVIAAFDTSIEKLVALAILMPIVASMGGNAATQTMTVAVRSIATRELTASNAVRIIWKEVMVGGINGALFAVLTGIAGGLLFQDTGLGLVLAAAMTINMVLAGLAGIVVPLGLERRGIDPAVASTVFVTTITDVFGFFSFLGLGAWFLI